MRRESRAEHSIHYSDSLPTMDSIFLFLIRVFFFLLWIVYTSVLFTISFSICFFFACFCLFLNLCINMNALLVSYCARFYSLCNKYFDVCGMQPQKKWKEKNTDSFFSVNQIVLYKFRMKCEKTKIKIGTVFTHYLSEMHNFHTRK